MTETRAIVVVVVCALLIEVGGTLGLMAIGVASTALIFPALVALLLAGTAIGEVVTRYGGKIDRRA